ncbi:MAG TPA: hypothetical protein VNS22_24885 [Geminicoccus sp.]|uniref:hypothetical protein n=1 Tax=Geminicoccus sp. TaxID=2024832 RepID=UPI002C458D65|nr:hypothetical protein [Geminicoccus sp.]HWL71594.1 hypothetical protein [Geminicoccus sp.]
MQISRRSFVIGASAVLMQHSIPSISLAQSGGMEPYYHEIIQNRGRYGKVCHLFGDSIMRGWALGEFWDGEKVDPTRNGNGPEGVSSVQGHPLSCWYSIAACMRDLAVENRQNRLGIGYAGGADPSMVRALVENGTIRTGDYVIFEDAGDHGADPVAYFHKVRNWRQSVINRVNATCILMTMFDYRPFRGQYPNMEYDRRYRILDGRILSTNDAIRMAASSIYWKRGQPLGRTILIDMNRRMDEWRNYCLAHSRLDPIHTDGVHPNCWGQWLMVREILQAMGRADLRTVRIERNVQRASENWQFLGYGTARPDWSPDRAAFHLRRLFRQI